MPICNPGSKRMRNSAEKKMPIKKSKPNEPHYLEHALLVDGITETRRTEHSLLEALGIHTEPVNSASEAMRVLVTGARFDFIIVDFDLPMVRGPELVRQIRAMGIESKIMGMCTNDREEIMPMFRDAGAVVTVSKPLTPTLFGLVIEVLRLL